MMKTKLVLHHDFLSVHHECLYICFNFMLLHNVLATLLQCTGRLISAQPMNELILTSVYSFMGQLLKYSITLIVFLI